MRLRSFITPRIARGIGAVTLAAASAATGLIGATAAGAATTTYYVAMGDSLGQVPTS